jgi:adenylosuccinate lyase
MDETFTHETYLSPLTWRYGSPDMRRIWSEAHKRRLWRRVWVALAEAEAEAGLVTREQAADLAAHAGDLDMARAAEIEAEIGHDLMAEVRTYAEQCQVGGGIIHLGATSADVEDNADVVRMGEALDLIIEKLRILLLGFALQIERHAGEATMAFTHLQPAEPTTTGYRLAQYGQDLLADWAELRRARGDLRGKGLRGAVGTSASYAQLLRESDMTPGDLEARVMAALGLEAAPVATQVYPRKQDYRVLSALAGLAGSLYKFAFDLRLLQSPPIGEWAEPFGSRQVGSSAMPFKRNPVAAENVCSLARMLAALPRVAWDNAAHSLLERTLDDSANRRLILPEAFLLADEILRRSARLVDGLQIDAGASARLLANYGVFAATERVLMEVVRRGADRQAMHEIIREHSLAAWAALRAGQANPLADRLAEDARVTAFATPDEVRGWLDAADYVGNAKERALSLAQMLRAELAV